MESQTAVARHLGVHKVEVNRGIKNGRLNKCVVRDPLTGKTLGITSLEEAAVEWRANGDYTDAPQRLTQPPAEPDYTPTIVSEETLNLAEASALAKHWDAKTKELKYREAARELVPVADVVREWADILTTVRTRLLSIPTAVKQQASHLSVADVGLVERLVREALEDLVASENRT